MACVELMVVQFHMLVHLASLSRRSSCIGLWEVEQCRNPCFAAIATELVFRLKNTLVSRDCQSKPFTKIHMTYCKRKNTMFSLVAGVQLPLPFWWLWLKLLCPYCITAVCIVWCEAAHGYNWICCICNFLSNMRWCYLFLSWPVLLMIYHS